MVAFIKRKNTCKGFVKFYLFGIKVFSYCKKTKPSVISKTSNKTKGVIYTCFTGNYDTSLILKHLDFLNTEYLNKLDDENKKLRYRRKKKIFKNLLLKVSQGRKVMYYFMGKKILSYKKHSTFFKKCCDLLPQKSSRLK